MPNRQCVTVLDVGSETPWIECPVTRDRTYRIRISQVRTFARTIDDDAPDDGAAPSPKARI
jgi:hypothetical protein